MVYSRAERVFILEHYFASKSSAAVREAFSNAYPDKEVPNEPVHRLVTKFRDTGSVCDRKCPTSDSDISALIQITTVLCRNIDDSLFFNSSQMTFSN
jgi:hypothetical protein